MSIVGDDSLCVAVLRTPEAADPSQSHQYLYSPDQTRSFFQPPSSALFPESFLLVLLYSLRFARVFACWCSRNPRQMRLSSFRGPAKRACRARLMCYFAKLRCQNIAPPEDCYCFMRHRPPRVERYCHFVFIIPSLPNSGVVVRVLSGAYSRSTACFGSRAFSFTFFHPRLRCASLRVVFRAEGVLAGTDQVGVGIRDARYSLIISLFDSDQ